MSTLDRTTVPMPQMGVSVNEGTVVAWHVQVGDAVVADQALCDVSTDKVETEITAPVAGFVAELVAAVGETVDVGAPLVTISATETAASPAAPTTSAGSASAPPTVADSASGDTRDVTAAATGETTSGDGTSRAATSGRRRGANGRSSDTAAALAGATIDVAVAADAVLDRPHRDGATASPVARRIADAHGVDLAAVAGTGRRGRITKADVETVVHAGQAPPPASPAPLAPPALPAPTLDEPPATGPRDVAPPPGYEDVPHEIVTTTPLRRAVSEHMTRSRRTAAHMTTEYEVDMHRVSTVRREVNAQREAAGQPRISFLSFIARAAVATLGEYPALNATFLHEHAILYREVNLGVAVDTPSGLIVPVIRGAERLTVGAIADAIAEQAERARRKQLTADDLRAGTFTISNPGSVGAASAPAIINQPQVAILGTPAIVRRPWVVALPDGSEAIVPRPIMKLALTFDHRAIDGADATRYVVAVGRALETWDAAAYR